MRHLSSTHIGILDAITQFVAVLSLFAFFAACGTSQSVNEVGDAGERPESSDVVPEQTGLTPQSDVNESVSLRDGAFTSDQVSRGLRVFTSICKECHTPESFAESGFMDAWAGQPVSKLFDQVRYTMPETDPGALSNAQYADVLTYLFQLNGLPAGDDEMPSDSDALASILIDRAGDQ